MTTINNVFVLMLENRSFDHFFGLSGRAGVPRPTDSDFLEGATDQSKADPPHEFADVQKQVNGGKMDGFAPDEKLAFNASQIPIISQLADEFLLFDNWYSSLPGPTWPNRFFIHAASSGGLAASPRAADSAAAVALPWAAFTFENGSIFDRLAAAGKKWRVYHGDLHPQVMAVEGMVAKSFDPDLFRAIYPLPAGGGDLANDLSSGGYDVDYTFIEPNYAIELFAQFVHGDSMHPRGPVGAGESLIKYVYECIRNSDVWPRSTLLIVWDEHGGFYDQTPPPAASPPGDMATNRARAGADSPAFGFDRLGVRVPALLISPWVQKGVLGSQVFPGATFDHASVVRSVREHFGLTIPLTQRDATTATWLPGLTAEPRNGATDGPARLVDVVVPVSSAAPLTDGTELTISAENEPDPFVEGIALIALDLDKYVSALNATEPLATTKFQAQVALKSERVAAQAAGADFHLQLLAYIQQVDAKVQLKKVQMQRP